MGPQSGLRSIEMGILDRAKAAGQSAAKPAAGGQKKSRYGGLAPREGRSPFFNEAGTHMVEIVKSERLDPDAKNPWLKVEVKVLQSDVVKPGELRTIKRDLHAKAFAVTGPEIISMAMACLGFTDEAEFHKSLTDQVPGVEAEALVELLCLCIEGDAEAIAEMGPDGTPIFGANPLANMKAKITVMPLPPLEGRTTSVLSNYSWYPI
jgi:hypothetical protein